MKKPNIVEVPDDLLDVFMRVVKERDKADEHVISNIKKGMKKHGVRITTREAGKILLEMDMNKENSIEELLGIIGALMMAVDVNEELIAEKSIRDIDKKLEEIDLEHYIQLAHLVDLDNLTMKDILGLSRDAFVVVSSALNVPVTASFKSFVAIRDIARLIYMFETTDIPGDVKPNLIAYIAKKKDEYQALIEEEK